MLEESRDIFEQYTVSVRNQETPKPFQRVCSEYDDNGHDNGVDAGTEQRVSQQSSKTALLDGNTTWHDALGWHEPGLTCRLAA